MKRSNSLLFLALGLMLASVGHTQTLRSEDRLRSESKWRKIWQVSVAAVAAANTMDAVSSWSGYETNPLLRGSNGQFGPKAVFIKAGISGGMIGLQCWLTRKHPEAYKSAAIANFINAGVLSGVAAHNWSIRSRSVARAQGR